MNQISDLPPPLQPSPCRWKDTGDGNRLAQLTAHWILSAKGTPANKSWPPLILASLTTARSPGCPFKPLHSVSKPPQTLLTYSSCFPPSPKVKYKSDLNLTRGIGWTPPGSYKVEMARRAAELVNARGLRGAYVSSGCKPTPAGKALGEGKLIVSFQTLFLAKGQLALKMCERQLRQGA